MSRPAVAALTLAFVLAHLPFLPVSLEDIDSVNFALGVRDFDVAQHRPHPPGYPVYIALAKAAAAVFRNEARALSALSLAGATLVIVSLYLLFSCLSQAGSGRVRGSWRSLEPRALAATALAVACPLFWYMAVRPMSDVPGLAVALASIACLAVAWQRQQPAEGGDRRLAPPEMEGSGRMIVLGSLVAAIAIGFRSQNAMIALPFLLAVLVDRIGRGFAGAILGGGVAFLLGVAVWGIPLLAASGGFNAYLAALGTQAGEDFAGVDMLYLNPSPRHAADALLRTFIYPWDSVVLGTIVMLLAAVGSFALLRRNRRTFAAVAVLAVPYLVFHLLFQDMNFVRYALPLVPPVAFLAVCGLDFLARRAALAATGVLALWSVLVASPVLAAYAAEPSPVIRLLEAMRGASPNAGRVALGMHQTFQRPLEADAVPIQERLPSPPRREWLELARYWREGNVAPVWFLADPRRTDLALVDPMSRLERRDFAWRFTSLSQVGGIRPTAVAWYRLPAPGWFAEEGWALTPETAGVARVMGRGPHIAPIAAWVRGRDEGARMLIGGRHLGSPQDGPLTFTAMLDGESLANWTAAPGFFLHVFDVPAGTLAGQHRLHRLEIQSVGSKPTAIEQFDLQSAGTLMWGFDAGWHEAEYNPRIGLWRWTSERAALRIVDPAAPVAIRLHIESPLRYFDAPPTVKVTAAGQTLAQVHATDTSVLEVVVPLEALHASDGAVMVETDRTFVPADRGGPPDHRRLGLRVFGVDVALVRN